MSFVRLRIGELALYTLGIVVNAYTLLIHGTPKPISTDVLKSLSRTEMFQDYIFSNDMLPPHLQRLRELLRECPSSSTDDSHETKLAGDLRSARTGLLDLLQQYWSLTDGSCALASVSYAVRKVSPQQPPPPVFRSCNI